ncbi:M3 family metallopeptidase [Leptospira sp. GIMC2001]|uniref:M3 family metallopeptidase n=1 Tax=Leptospira sp. GIMC2001 TaxID=1513297 RepID=UPI0023494CC4|nr:M3 family metallopeptidase [Leptospira sp. GIMC2001]WCL50153.1 M3 family metallopeptidase [Leptospira sp. GIMC2001]
MSFPEFRSDNLDNKKINFLDKVKSNKDELERLLALDQIDYENFLVPYQKMNHDLDVIFTEISHLNSVKNSKETQAIYTELLPIISDYYTTLSQDKRILAAYESALTKNVSKLNQARLKVLNDGIRDFKLSGVDLPSEQKDRLKAINIRLSECSNQFSQNILDATNSYEKIITDPKDVEGIPESDLRAATVSDNQYKFTLQIPSYMAYMTYGPNRSIREELYRAYTTRAPQNGALIEEILQLKKELASLLGFSDYSEYSLAVKMADSTKSVLDFLNGLASKARPLAEKELRELQVFASSKGLDKLESHDVAFYSELLKKETLHFNEEEYRPYFEKEKLVAGGFQFLEKLLGIQFKLINVDVWEPTVQVFELSRNNSPFARLYVDLEARQDKKGGAWMHNWHSRHKTDGTTILPTAFIVGNFPPSLPDNPSLLRHNDVVTFFHEMGHALHHLMTVIEEPFVSGINGVEWDAVEFPSQFLENFAYEREALKFFAYHYKTGEPIPDSMIQKLIDTKNFQSAMGVVRQLEFAIFDLKIHKECPDEEGVQKILDSVRKEVAVLIPPAYNKFQNGFSHIFAGGYAAGYYSYKWAELLSANAFFRFVDNGIFDSKLSESYCENILFKGGSEPAMDLFRKFYGKDPDINPLLRLLGLAA